ncbi:hypothetical protein [Streptosporangium sp. NPDC000396]|uniref:hypothetical protein n=1 Tax=Streptosporangium sp. NPDC000396 TaxID=3366185 RepID=UPI0036A0720B
MEIWERSSIRFMLNAKLDELHGEGFEDFFHDVMCVLNPGFLNVRTAGRLGDQGADGLLLCGKKLYACYAPQTVVPSSIAGKFKTDLAKAIEKRGNEFKTFVFVHNDRRGIHPEVASLLATARDDHPELSFENFGRRHFYAEFCRMEKWQSRTSLARSPQNRWSSASYWKNWSRSWITSPNTGAPLRTCRPSPDLRSRRWNITGFPGMSAIA